MANRSYLYATDTVPTTNKPNPSYGLAQYNSDVPLVFKLIMAGSPRRTPSAIWGQPIGIIADREGAQERVEAFAKLLLEKHPKRKDLEAQLEQMRAVLAKTPKTKYLLLETGEVADMMGDDLVDTVDMLIAEIPVAVKLAADPKKVALLRKTKFEDLNLGYWTDVLYFDLPKPKKIKTNAKKSAAKKPATKKPVAKKPAQKKPVVAKKKKPAKRR